MPGEEKTKLNLRIPITRDEEENSSLSPMMHRVSSMQIKSPIPNSSSSSLHSSLRSFSQDSPQKSFLITVPNKENQENGKENTLGTSNGMRNPLGRKSLSQSCNLKRRLFDLPTNEETEDCEDLEEPLPSPRNSKRLSLRLIDSYSSLSDDSNSSPLPLSSDEELEGSLEDVSKSPSKRTLSHSVSSPSMGFKDKTKAHSFICHRAITKSGNGHNSSPMPRRKRSDSIRNILPQRPLLTPEPPPSSVNLRSSSPSDGWRHKSTDNLQPSLSNEGSMRRALSTAHSISSTYFSEEAKALLPSTKKDGCFFITHDTVSRILGGELLQNNPYLIVDCRFAYEYNGGHIKDAINVVNSEELEERFLKQTLIDSKKTVIIFHCEFSSKRGPSLCSQLRKRDREIHYSSYPELHYPEIYVLEGGYKKFFNEHKDLCEPSCYVTMDDPSFKKECKDGMDSINQFKMRKCLSLNNLSTAQSWTESFRQPPRRVFPLPQSTPSTPTLFPSSESSFSVNIPASLSAEPSFLITPPDVSSITQENS